ncbi:hypothetical protein TWF506_006422 [Arthrobotrys conoides]|uniref:PepSY domain-containing protein n=1 Tax=Arthrobotrys conoides TaxID=74498 RepID=A0AAN8NM10_9PEZI
MEPTKPCKGKLDPESSGKETNPKAAADPKVPTAHKNKIPQGYKVQVTKDSGGRKRAFLVDAVTGQTLKARKSNQ